MFIKNENDPKSRCLTLNEVSNEKKKRFSVDLDFTDQRDRDVIHLQFRC